MRFKVGDVVVTTGCVQSINKGFVGREATILEKLPTTLFGEPIYRTTLVGVSGNGIWLESHLALKRPPQTELGSWDEIERVTGWHPEREVA